MNNLVKNKQGKQLDPGTFIIILIIIVLALLYLRQKGLI